MNTNLEPNQGETGMSGLHLEPIETREMTAVEGGLGGIAESLAAAAIIYFVSEGATLLGSWTYSMSFTPTYESGDPWYYYTPIN